MKKYQPYCKYPPHRFASGTISKMFWLLDSNISEIYPCNPYIVFMAFTIESYLNTIGNENISYWNELEQLSWRKKINILYQSVGKKVDWGKEPLQFATELFKLRNELAHGKNEQEILGDLYDTREEAKNALENMTRNWHKSYEKVDRQWVIESVSRYTALMEGLSELAKHPRYSYTSAGEGGILEVQR